MIEYVLEDGSGGRINTLEHFNEQPPFDEYETAHRCLPWLEQNPTVEDPVTIEAIEAVEAVEQDDRTTESGDSNDTMNYEFLNGDNDEQDDNNDDAFSTVGNMWTLGDHNTASSEDTDDLTNAISDTMAALDDDVDDDLMAVLQDANDMVETTSVRSFECPVCGLSHSHSDHKHDIRSGFQVEDSFADQMDFCPYCHCGVNELAMLMPFFPYMNEPVFEDQHEFESVLELDANVLQGLIQDVISGKKSPERAYLTVLQARFPGFKDEIQMFLSRVDNIQNAANGAPIPQDARQQIENNRNGIEGALSE